MTEKEALLKMESYCSTAEHCIYDVRKKLDNCELQKDEAERIINKLQQQGFVDEKRYAAAFVHDKLFFAKWGRLGRQCVPTGYNGDHKQLQPLNISPKVIDT
jgi:regulatory protein